MCKTSPHMTWKQMRMCDRWGDDPCLVTTYFEGAIERVEAVFRPSICVFYVYFRDGSHFQWNNTIASVYNSQFGISVSHDGRFLFVQTWDKGLFCYDAKTGKQVWRTKRRLGITNLFVNDTTILVHQHEKALQLLNIETGEVLKEKKPARAWGYYPLDGQHLICHTCAKHWEIIRASDLETVEIIPQTQFPHYSWCIRNVFLENGNLKYQAFRNVWDGNRKLPNEEAEGYIKIHYQEEP